MSTWVTKTLAEVSSIYNGGTPDTKVKEYWGDEIFWITPKDMGKLDGINVYNTERKLTVKGLKNSSAKVLPVNSVILSSRAPIGHLAINKIEICTNQGCKGIVPSSQLDTSFLYYFLKSSVDLLNSLGTGTTFKELSAKKLGEVLIPFPSLKEQKRIVSILDEAFAAIDKAKENAEKNLKNARELFESYLTSIYEGQLKNTVNLSSVAEIASGYSFKSNEFKPLGNYQVLRIGNVKPGLIRKEESPIFISDVSEAILGKALLQINDVVITQTGTKKKRDYGYTAIVDSNGYLLNQRVARIRFSKGYLAKYFLYYSWTDLFKDQFFANENGTVGQGNVGIGAITNASVPNSSLTQQKEVVQLVDELRNAITRIEDVYKQKLKSLEELKKSILQKAFTGELTSKRIPQLA